MFEKFESKKTLANSTQKIYLQALNRLAIMEIDTRQKLMDNQELVVSVLDCIFDEDTDKQRYEKRVYLSAIFWALHDEPLDKKQTYYQAFQKAKQNYGKPAPSVE